MNSDSHEHKGRVLACFHDEWEVALEDGRTLRASVRARHFANLPEHEKLLAAGDMVDVSVREDGAAVIERVHPRETSLSRLRPRMRKQAEQVIIANVEQLVAVASLGAPRLNRRMLDRVLVIAESADLRSVIVFNKIDLVHEREWLPAAAAYEQAGYDVVATSATDGTNIDELASLVRGRFSVFSGPSGAGKSSLLNAIEPGLDIRVREVGQKTHKGKHTTTNVTIFRLDDGTLVADTPGFRELGFWKIRADELDYLFPEFREYIPRCRFTTCSHSAEPDCAVKKALEEGRLPRWRYESYVRLLESVRTSSVPRATDVEQPEEQITKKKRRPSRRARKQALRRLMEQEQDEG